VWSCFAGMLYQVLAKRPTIDLTLFIRDVLLRLD
jgi:hypothetical protein